MSVLGGRWRRPGMSNTFWTGTTRTGVGGVPVASRADQRNCDNLCDNQQLRANVKVFCRGLGIVGGEKFNRIDQQRTTIHIELASSEEK